jgi:thiol-disulfide isomerase/thioredoxin
MKIQYLAAIASISILGVGAIVGCANPCAAKTQAPSAEAVSSNPCAAKTNPCAAKANPCAAKTNPCAAKTNPCAAKANPCAAKTNPCAAKSNPCAGKEKSASASSASVGASLAQELQGKPVVVDIFAEWCPACKNVAPTLSQLKQEYAGKVHFVVLDITDRSKTLEAETRAQQLGLSDFLATNKSQTGTLTIIDPATGNILAQHRNNPNIADYQTVLDAALNQ